MTSTAKHGAIACGHALTAHAGEAMLREGGNAVDAAIAAAAMACVVEPVLAGPAGGGFAMVQAGSGAPELCDFFCETPKRRNPRARMQAALADFGDATQTFHIGPGSVAASCFIEGLHALHERHGRLPWRSLFVPAAEVAERGHALSHFQASLLRIIRPIVTHTPAARALFAPQGDVLEEGDTLVNSGQARLWRLLADGGLQAWRNEVWPALLQAASPTAGGHLREEDLRDCHPQWRTPMHITLEEPQPAQVWLNPPPAASGVLIALAFAHLRQHADRAADCLPCAAACALKHADALRRQSSHELTRLLAALPRAWRGTTHISVIDTQGVTCAMTISNGEGNGQVLEDFGFMPNNMLGEEDVNPAGEAFPEGVRLSSMMAPTIARDAQGAHIALGSGGSNRIRSALLLVLARLLLAGETLEQAVNAPRLHVEGDALDIEPGLPADQLAQLRAGFPEHRLWQAHGMFFGGVHAVMRDADDALRAIGDFRRDGVGLVV